MSRRCQSLLTTQQTSIHACTNCFLQAYRYRCLGDQIRHIIKQILDSYVLLNHTFPLTFLETPNHQFLFIILSNISPPLLKYRRNNRPIYRRRVIFSLVTLHRQQLNPGIQRILIFPKETPDLSAMYAILEKSMPEKNVILYNSVSLLLAQIKSTTHVRSPCRVPNLAKSISSNLQNRLNSQFDLIYHLLDQEKYE